MSLNELREALQLKLGIINHTLSDEELREISESIQRLPKARRTEASIETIVKSVTGLDRFMKTEAVDLSDVEHLIQQILDELKKNK